MALYFVRTELRTTIAYVINSEEPLTKEGVQKLIDEGQSLRDFAQRTGQENVNDCFEITPEKYLETFDEVYPGMKSLDKASKYLQISDMNDKVLDEMLSANDKDEY